MARAAAVRALPWARILVIARIVMARFGQDLVRILRQVDLGKLSREIAAVGATGRLLRR